MNIGTIRRQNLEALISEAGSRRELCRRAETSYSYLTQILTRRKMESGRSREVGHKLARSLERGMNKPQGWMDQIHNNKEQTDNSLTLNVKTLSNALKFIDEYLRDNYYSNTVNLRAKTLALLYELMADKHGASLDHKTIIKIIGEIDKRIEQSKIETNHLWIHAMVDSQHEESLRYQIIKDPYYPNASQAVDFIRVDAWLQVSKSLILLDHGGNVSKEVERLIENLKNPNYCLNENPRNHQSQHFRAA